ncbi:uncharacterized protein I303_107630 [Kwoniella dejecticola CBS 10117]|uniref:Spc7 kinetochore protein domain-containing protein n=1 Tax=Kwoniella dejecticola CBS 10117 TaxID=1296121 RepID=A0A1A5ZV96_9TREE|nr:uncharacterized protein I303_07641 [Kwoniella dejecticola CBS 10117]OBR81731.1 hypothetical protein I303_07641 [Kwoniella dejecticola CBS 10117]
MSIPARSPRSLPKSQSLGEKDLNLDHITLPVTNKEFKAKKRGAVSVGGEGLSDVGPQSGKAPGEMSPRRQARRHAQPRKSILKALPSRQDDSEDTTLYAHTIAFPSSQTLLNRRVSFAPNAHVRMFEKSPMIMSPDGTPAAASVNFALPAASSGSRSSASTHSRRSSIQNIGSVSKPNIFAPSIFHSDTTQGEESMDLEEDEEYEHQGTVESGRQISLPQGPLDLSLGVGQQTAHVESEEEEEEMDMDITQNVYGGIVRRASMAPTTTGDTTVDSDVTEEADITTRSDESKTMDFTIAVGGLVPPQAPEGARSDRRSNRSSIGYSFHIPGSSSAQNLRPGEAIEGEAEIEMEETVAFGGIIGPDDSISSSEDTMNSHSREKTMTFTFNHSVIPPQDDDDGTEMTVAQGGIINLPPPSPYPASPARTQAFASPGRALPTNTRPMSGTPSFAKATLSSSKRSKDRESMVTSQKRNVFAPSPSPTKSTTPKKAGMQVAVEVAKRLSFGSATSAISGDSASKKRAREISASPSKGESKRNKMDEPPQNAAEEVFGGTPISDPVLKPRTSLFGARTSLGAPRGSLGTPMRIARSPASLRQSLVRVADPEPEPEPEVEAEEAEPEWEQPQNISLAAFLEMTGVQFMEGLPGLNRRRSSVGKGLLGQSYSGGDRDFALHEYSEAQVNSIFLNMYTWAANKLRDDIRIGQSELDLFESRCDEDSPPVIQEYLSATDEDKQLFELTFKSFKTNTQLKAKELWYDWKLQLMQTIKPDVEAMMVGMQEDNDRLTALNEETESILPALKARQAALQAELERERQIVAEIAECDQQELASLKEGIAEQGTQINVFNSELEESTSKLAALTTKLQELNSTKKECVHAIQHAKSQCDQFTKSDAIRLREEYNSIQRLHLWRPIKIHHNLLELEFDNEISLTLSCSNHLADLSSAQITYLHEKAESNKSGPTVKRGTQTPTQGLFGMLEIAVREMVKAKTFDTLSSFVQRIGQLWSVSQRLRAELHYVNFRHPMTYTLRPESNALIASVTMVLPTIKSKVIVDLAITQETIWGYPENLAGTDIEIRRVYGKADVQLLSAAAKQPMAASTPQGCLGAFLQVCVDVAGQYIK